MFGEKMYFDNILYKIDKHMIIPFLGAGMAKPFIPLAKELAIELVNDLKLLEQGYPTEHS